MLGSFASSLSKSGQLLLPMVDLIEQCRIACDELIDVAGRARFGVVGTAGAGPRQQGKQLIVVGGGISGLPVGTTGGAMT